MIYPSIGSCVTFRRFLSIEFQLHKTETGPVQDDNICVRRRQSVIILWIICPTLEQEITVTVVFLLTQNFIL